MKKTKRQRAAIERLFLASHSWVLTLGSAGAQQDICRELFLEMLELGGWKLDERAVQGAVWLGSEESVYTVIRGGALICFAGRKLELIMADLARETEQQELRAIARRGQAKAQRLASKRREPAAATRQAMRI